MNKHTLKAIKRETVGSKVKDLRKQGLLPANIYGKGIESIAVQVPIKDFEKTFRQTHETGLVELELEGNMHPILIHNVQLDYMTQEPIHADFYQVNLKEKVKTMIPITLIGEPIAVTDKLGLLLHVLQEVEVEALPADLPEKIEIEVGGLAVVDDQVTVENIKVKPEVTILTPTDEVVAKITQLISKEAEKEAAEEAAAATEAKAEGTEEAAAATEAATDEKTQETAKTEEKK